VGSDSDGSPAEQSLAGLRDELAANARATLELLVQRPDDEDGLARLDASARVLRARIAEAERKERERRPYEWDLLARGIRITSGG
jgi:hypothetical protein